MTGLLPILFCWFNPPAACGVTALEVWDAYISGPGTKNYTWGTRLLSPSTICYDLAPHKPYLGCAVAWEFPVSLGSDGQPLPPECQPFNFSTEYGSWEGM
jgi:hypothetical protein